jgi:hypothetical protein
MMVTFLFWNLNKKPLEAIVANLVWQHEVDVLMLAECAISPKVMLKTLNQEENQFYLFSSDSRWNKVFIYIRFPEQFLSPELESDRVAIHRLMLPARTEILLAVTHFPSKRYYSDVSQSIECTPLAEDILRIEQAVGHSRTVLVGDLNMNPFEHGVVAAAGLNAVMTQEIALRQTRIVQGRQYPFFYNPMWGHLGDRTEGPPGTYYYSSSEQVTFFWNTFDQVLLRPDVIRFFRNGSLKILNTDGTTSFLSKRGLPNTPVVSDHLPLNL